MKKSYLPLLIAASLLCSSANAEPINCPGFSDPNTYYQGPDKQILLLSHFATNPWVIQPNAVPYLNRLIGAIERRGSQVVLMSPPLPPFAYLGKLDPATIAGTKFEAANRLSQEALESAYLRSLKPFEDAGATIVNVQAGMLKYQAQHPDQPLYYKHDSHWHPNGAHAAAIATADKLKATFPQVIKDMPVKKIVVDDSQVVERVSYQSWDGLIRQKCPEYVGLNEKSLVVKLKEDSSNVSSSDLLGDEESPIAIVGTSFTSPASHANYGFDLYLSSILGNRVLNQSGEGGGPLGSMLNYYATRPKDQADPKILIWELPVSQIGFSSLYPLDPSTIRQILPFVVKGSSKVAEMALPKLAEKNSLDIKNGALIGSEYFLHLNLGNLQAPKLKAKLTYADGQTEDIELYRNKGEQFPGYVVELKDTKAALTKVAFDIDKALLTNEAGRVSILKEN